MTAVESDAKAVSDASKARQAQSRAKKLQRIDRVERGPRDGKALGFKAIRSLHPDYDLWRDFPYEYEFGKLAIDVINGGPALREWVDDCAATPDDLDALTRPDEQAWSEERKGYLRY